MLGSSTVPRPPPRKTMLHHMVGWPFTVFPGKGFIPLNWWLENEVSFFITNVFLNILELPSATIKFGTVEKRRPTFSASALESCSLTSQREASTQNSHITRRFCEELTTWSRGVTAASTGEVGIEEKEYETSYSGLKKKVIKHKFQNTARLNVSGNEVHYWTFWHWKIWTPRLRYTERSPISSLSFENGIFFYYGLRLNYI